MPENVDVVVAFVEDGAYVAVPGFVFVPEGFAVALRVGDVGVVDAYAGYACAFDHALSSRSCVFEIVYYASARVGRVFDDVGPAECVFA